jgi:hypothetical protein
MTEETVVAPEETAAAKPAEETIQALRVRDRQTIFNTEDAGLKMYLNGFPKAGLHLLDLFMRPLAIPMRGGGLWKTPWVGMFKGNSWTNERHEIEHIAYHLGRCETGRFLKGHMGHDHELSRFMHYLGMVHIFIYRDLRDVAVSQTFHIMDTSTRGKTPMFSHPGKMSYMALGGFDEILTAVIAGHDIYPGIFERWAEYSFWLETAQNIGRCFPVRYEDIMTDPLNWGAAIIRYTLNRLEEAGCGRPDEFPVGDAAEMMWEIAQKTDHSATYREGRVGGWRNHFKPYHVAHFKSLDEFGWIQRMGYEKGYDWQ